MVARAGAGAASAIAQTRAPIRKGLGSHPSRPWEGGWCLGATSSRGIGTARAWARRMGHPKKETESEGFFAPAPQRMRLRLARERCSHWGHALRTPLALRMTANALARAWAAVIIARRAGRANANSKARAAC